VVLNFEVRKFRPQRNGPRNYCFVRSWQATDERNWIKIGFYREVGLIAPRMLDTYKYFLILEYSCVIYSLISSLYIVLRFHDQLHPLLLSMFAIIFLAFAIANTFIYQYSVYLVPGQLKWLASHQNSLLSIKSYKAKALKSFQPFSVSIGGIFTVESPNFIIDVFWRLIFDNVVNLLLTFR